MKVAIMAGGMGTRLAEETETKPKPMVEVGGRPVLWHIMRHYAQAGFKEFIIALGYKGWFIKKYMAEYCRLENDLTIDFRTGGMRQHGQTELDWTVHLVETGLKTGTGGRIKRLREWIGNETFMCTWGDGVSDVDLGKLLAFHKGHGKIATVTAVRPPARFGHLEFEGDMVREFSEKPQTAEGWINGAFFVLEPKIFDYIEGDKTMFERGPLDTLAKEGELMAYRHDGFWQCMDTLRDKKGLERLWNAGTAPWKTWGDD